MRLPLHRSMLTAILFGVAGWAGAPRAAAEIGPTRVQIRSDVIRGECSLAGAELQSVVETKSGHEYLWQNPTGLWQGPAQVLFPIIGSLREDDIRWNGKLLPMGKHGFARSCRFAQVDKSPGHIVFQLSSEGDERVPCPFRLSISYRLEHFTPHVTALVEDTGTDVLPAAIGFRPAFSVSVPADSQSATASLIVEGVHSLIKLVEAPATRLLFVERQVWCESHRKLSLTQSALGQSASVLACESAVRVCLSDCANRRSVTLRTAAPNLGLWRKPHQPLIQPGHALHAEWSAAFN